MGWGGCRRERIILFLTTLVNPLSLSLSHLFAVVQALQVVVPPLLALARVVRLAHALTGKGGEGVSEMMFFSFDPSPFTLLIALPAHLAKVGPHREAPEDGTRHASKGSRVGNRERGGRRTRVVSRSKLPRPGPRRRTPRRASKEEGGGGGARGAGLVPPLAISVPSAPPSAPRPTSPQTAPARGPGQPEPARHGVVCVCGGSTEKKKGESEAC